MAEPATQINSLLSNVTVIAGLITVAGSLLTFAVGKVYELVRQGRQRKSDERRLRKALYTEIMHNREELMTAFMGAPPIPSFLSALENDPQRTVHAVYARNMRFFDALKDDLHILPDDVLETTLRFYNCVEMIYALFDSFQRESFKQMTAQGKGRMLEHLNDKLREGIKLGGLALGRFGWYYSDLVPPTSEVPWERAHMHIDPPSSNKH